MDALRRALSALAALALAFAPPAALAAPKRAVVVSSGAIRPLPAGDTLQVNPAAAGNASINLPHGTAPSAPVNGDCWTTTAGLFCRIDGATVGPMGEAGAGGGAGTVTSVAVAGGTTGLTTSGGPVTDAGTITLGGTLALAHGGTGASTAAGARTALELGNVDNTSDAAKPISTAAQAALDGKQPLDADLTSIAALTTTTAGRALLDDADAAAQRSTLGLGTLATQSGTFSGTSSGTNTGDQTSVSGNAGTATALATPRTISITGKATSAGGAFDGTGNLALNVTAVTLVAGDIPTIAQSQVTNLASDLAGKLASVSPAFTGTLSGADAQLTGKAWVGTTSFVGGTLPILGVKGTAADWTAQIEANTTSSNSFGIRLLAGTNASDTALVVRNAGNSATLLLVAGNGNTTVGGTLSASNLSGTNTGDQTSVSGNAGTATALATPRTISITGKATSAGGTFDGTGNLALNVTALTVDGAITPSSVAATGDISSSGGGIGFAAGNGGAVTQATSKSTGVTCNERMCSVTLASGALAAATIVTFAYTNSTISAEDQLVATHHATGTFGAYLMNCRATGAGTGSCALRNNSAGSLNEAPVFKITVIDGVNS